MIKIGITGGIGSGKSVVAELLQVMNVPVYNADEASKNILKNDDFIRNKLRNLLGDTIFFPNGELNRSQMASLIFNDPGLLSQTNAIIHPAVFDDFERWSQQQSSNIVGCESAIIFESGFNRRLDYVIMVSAPEEIRIARAAARDHAGKEQIIKRMKNQMPDDEKARLADFIVINDGRQAIIPQVRKLFQGKCNVFTSLCV